MLKLFLLLLLPFSLFALEISFQSGKEDNSKYTLLHVKEQTPFMCEAQSDSFNNIKKVICVFSKRPENAFKPLNDDFFNVVSEIKENNFFLIITPIYKMQLIPSVFDLTKDNTLFESDVKLSTAWTMIGYKENLPLIKKQKSYDGGLNIPITFSNDELQYVGGLDIQGNPVMIKQADDVKAYLNVKKQFDAKDYDKVVETIDDVIKSYPDTIFMSELLYYKIKSLSQLGKNDDVIDLSKSYLRNYSSDENVAEVLTLTALAYSKSGLNSDADYFYDRLFTEHADSDFSKLGMIYKADQLLDAGDTKKALPLYEKALEETKVVPTAAMAADRIANFYINKLKPQKAQIYVDKILDADADFYKIDVKKSILFANALAENELYLEAAKIGQIALGELKKENDDYEPLLKNSAIWLAKTEDKSGALKLLNRYVKEFPDGAFLESVNSTKDSLFFDLNDANTTTKLDKYTKMMESYKKDPIGQRALYKKAQLLMSLLRYSEVLQLKDQLKDLDEKTYPDVAQMILSAATNVAKMRLNEGDCSDVTQLIKEFSLNLPSEFDDPLYNCFVKLSEYDDAKAMAMKHVGSTLVTEKMKWLYKIATLEFKVTSYKDAILAGNDLFTLMGSEKSSPYNDIIRLLFDSYQRVNDSDNMILMMSKILDLYGDDFQDIERYVQMMILGDKRKDDNIIITYGDKVMKLQNKTASYSQSPFVEFALYQAYANKNNTTKALDVLYSLDKRNLTNDQRARQKYLLGALLQQQSRKDEAKLEFKKSIDANKDSPWAKLSSDALNLNN